jgi:hypothetical protein
MDRDQPRRGADFEQETGGEVAATPDQALVAIDPLLQRFDHFRPSRFDGHVPWNAAAVNRVALQPGAYQRQVGRAGDQQADRQP